MLTERSIINFLIWIGGMALGPFIAYSLVRQNPLPLMVIAALAGIFFIFAIAKDMLCVAPLVGTYVAGNLRLLPGKLNGYEFAAGAAILYYLITYSALRRKRVLTGPLYFFVPIVLFAALIFAHDPHVSLRMGGGGRQGGHGVIDILVTTLAYVCAVSMNSPSARWFSLTPLFCIAAATISCLPNVISTYIPKTAEFFYIFTDNVNVNAYVADIVGGEMDIRNGGLAEIGSALGIFLICYFPIHTWWRPDRWWVALLVLACGSFVVVGGYRGELVTFVFMLGLGIWCHSSWRALILAPPLLAVFAVTMIVQNSHLFALPEAAQRTLSFLPGDWDPNAIASTESSNEFRRRIRDVYLREEAGKHPWLGDGITYDGTEFERYTYLSQTAETPDNYYSTKEFISAKMFHIGWISAFDSGGFVGCTLLIILCGSLIWVSGRMVFSKSADRGSPLFLFKIWIFCNVAGNVFGFLTVFGDVKGLVPGICVYAIVWTHLHRLEKFGYRPPAKDRMVPFDPERARIPAPV